MSANDDRQGVSDFAVRFGLEALTPSNSLNIKLVLEDMTDQVEMNWGLVLLAVSGGYLPEHAVLDFALDSMNGDEGNAVEQLALMSFEEHPDPAFMDLCIAKVINDVALVEWEYGFEQLFYIAVGWLYAHWDGFDDPAGSLYDLDDDFYYIERGKPFAFHDSWPENASTRQELDICMHERCKRFLEEEKRRLEDFDFSNTADLESLDDIYEHWDRFNGYDLPRNIEDEARRKRGWMERDARNGEPPLTHQVPPHPSATT